MYILLYYNAYNNKYNQHNKARVCQLGDFLNHSWQNKGLKLDSKPIIIVFILI